MDVSLPCKEEKVPEFLQVLYHHFMQKVCSYQKWLSLSNHSVNLEKIFENDIERALPCTTGARAVLFIAFLADLSACQSVE
jgi:hypothetical protein